MKIQHIRLAAYGPFTDAAIDLSGPGPALHLLFGPNEAGKTSALNAIRHMLFGIPAQAAVNFLHDYNRLRIGATLVNDGGEAIEFLRRKGRIKTLRGPDDEAVLNDDALAPFLGGVGPELFEQMFAIGHQDLIRGGEEIISGKGSIGEALFAAGAGLIRLQEVQQALDQEAGALFKPNGSSPSINQAIREIKTARQRQKEAHLPPKTWQENDRERRDAQHRLAEVKATLVSHRQRQAKLTRIREALPLIARNREIVAGLDAYQGVPELSDDFGEKRRDAEKELKIAARDQERYRETIEAIRKAIEAHPLPAALLENAAAVEALQHELGSFRKAQQDRPGLDGRMRTLQQQASELLEEITADVAVAAPQDFRLPPAAVGEIQRLGKEYDRLTAKYESARDQRRRLADRFGRLAEQREAIPAPVDTLRLEHALQSAQAAGAIERQLADTRLAAVTLEDRLNRQLNRQLLWSGSLADVDTLPLPSGETIDRFEARFDALRRTLDKHRETKITAEGEIAQTETEIRAIDRSGEVPTETDLKNVRVLRGKGWELIRQRLEGRTPSAAETRDLLRHFDPAPDLPEAFEKSMLRADDIADRLRREADQVTRKGMLEANLARLNALLVDVDTALRQAAAEKEALETEWREAWAASGIVPQTPREMRAWAAEMASLREKHAVLRSNTIQGETLAAQLTALRADLSTALAATGEPPTEDAPLTLLIKTAQAHITIQRERKADIASADKALANLKLELEAGVSAMAELEEALSRWKTDWAKSVNRIGLDAVASPTAALAVIERVREVKNKTGEADTLRKRIAGIDRDSAEFIARVDALADLLAPDLKNEPQDRAAELLNGRLTAARKAESTQLGMREQLASARKELERADRRIFECRALIETLCNEACCTDAGALAETENRARERKALIRELSDLDRQLRKLSAGATVDAFIADAAAVDADSIIADLESLEEAVEGLEKERSALDQKIGALSARLDQMDGNSAAAMHAELAERLLAGLEVDVEHYARVKIAALILSRTVERYREKHQGPLINRASELFARMTTGAFSRLRADYDDKGKPVLVGIRSGSGAAVAVGGMSDGTADQLYLALRLASLEQYLENNETLPFVVDDILLRFDDDRALATLEVLAGLAQRTQILFFTHHQHLVDLAGGARRPGLAFSLHRLG